MDMVKIIYPCNHCLCCSLDLNNPQPYICTRDGHHSWCPEALSSDCTNKEMINWAIKMNTGQDNKTFIQKASVQYKNNR